MIYIGTGNGSLGPQRAQPAGGDNLYLASLVALNAEHRQVSGTTRRHPATTGDSTVMILAGLVNIDSAPRR
jgi:quinohemoprotein ethanol dehydrogenase